MSHKWNFKAPMQQGIAPRQAHANIPDGLWERELARNAFFGAATNFYHRNPPTAWTAIDKDGPRPYLFDTRRGIELTPSPWDAAELLVNATVKIRYWKTSGNMDHLVRNADGDELIFMQQGQCELFCDFGHITLVKGDYFILPRGTMWRIEAASPVEMLMIESTDAPYRLPEDSILGRHLPFDAGVFDVPALDEAFGAQARNLHTQVRIKHSGRLSSLVYPFNPLDAEGWKGDLYPIRLNVKDIRTISSHRAHVVPSGHTTFLTDSFLVCTFMPYPSPSDPTTLKLPAFHDNVDYDEVLFLHDGNKTALTAGFEPGLMTFDPRGVTHGPMPSVLPMFHDKSGISMANEFTIIMVDTRHPLTPGKDAARQEISGSEMLHAKAVALAPDAQDSVARSFAPLNQGTAAGAVSSAPADASLSAPAAAPAPAASAPNSAPIPATHPQTLSKQTMSNALASQIMAGAVAKAQAMGVPMSIALSDIAGNLMQFQRMDHASLLSAGIAQDKAYSSAATRMPTDRLHEFIKNDAPLAAGFVHTPRLVVFGGGYPIVIDGAVVGAIGVSGGHYSQDMQVAQAGLAAAGLI